MLPPQDNQAGFQIIGILLGLCLHIALQGGQILRIVSREESRWMSREETGAEPVTFFKDGVWAQ